MHAVSGHVKMRKMTKAEPCIDLNGDSNVNKTMLLPSCLQQRDAEYNQMQAFKQWSEYCHQNAPKIPVNEQLKHNWSQIG